MKQTKKIRLVIEADVQQDTEITPEVVARICGHAYDRRVASEGFAENLEANKLLLTALLASPEAQHNQLLRKLAGALESLPIDGFEQLSGQQREKDIESLVPTLPPDAATYFEEASDFFFDFADLADYALKVDLTRIYLEDAD